MTKKNAMTPLQAARQYAEAHPDFEGNIILATLRPKGRGGWKGLVRTRVVALAREGEAVLKKEVRGRRLWNGRCYACGRIFLEPVLQDVYGADARHGQPVTPKDDALYRYVSHGGRPLVYGRLTEVRSVCPVCAQTLGEKYGLQPLAEWPGTPDESSDRCEIYAAPEGYFVALRPLPYIEIDLTKSETASE